MVYREISFTNTSIVSEVNIQ